MNKSTQEALIRFTRSSTWQKCQGADDDNFTDFIIVAFMNGDNAISIEDFLLNFSGEINEDLKYKISNLHNRYSEGIRLLSRSGFGE